MYFKKIVFIFVTLVPLLSLAQPNLSFSIAGQGSSWPVSGTYNLSNTLPKDTDSQIRISNQSPWCTSSSRFYLSSDPYLQNNDKLLSPIYSCGYTSNYLTIESADLSNGTFGNKVYIIYTHNNQLIKVHTFDLVDKAEHEVKLSITKFPSALDTKLRWVLDDIGLMETEDINLTVRLIDFQTGEIRVIYNQQVPSTFHTVFISSSEFSNSNYFDLMVIEAYPICSTSHCKIKTGQNTAMTGF